MTDTHRSLPPSPARDPASAMDQALDWLIVLGSPDEEQTRQFHAWLDADPLNAQAFAHAPALETLGHRRRADPRFVQFQQSADSPAG